MEVAGVTLTHPERVLFPGHDITKGDLAQYYAAVAPRMLPHIVDRPLTLVRCEKGVTRADALRSECRFLRHEPGWHRWVKEPIRRIASGGGLATSASSSRRFASVAFRRSMRARSAAGWGSCATICTSSSGRCSTMRAAPSSQG